MVLVIKKLLLKSLVSYSNSKSKWFNIIKDYISTFPTGRTAVKKYKPYWHFTEMLIEFNKYEKGHCDRSTLAAEWYILKIKMLKKVVLLNLNVDYGLKHLKIKRIKFKSQCRRGYVKEKMQKYKLLRW